jgi:hypothetical protein
MVDFPSVRVSGAVTIARARALYNDGVLRLYGKSGRITELQATQPVLKKGWFRSWYTMTDKGILKLSARCLTCGGWRKVTRAKADELWMM